MSQEIKKILPVIFLIAAAGLGWLSWQSYADILILQDQIKESEDKVAVLNKALEKTKELAGFAKKNPEIAEKMNIILPDSASKPGMVSSLAKAASSNGLLLKNISFENLSNAQIVYSEDGTQNTAEEKYKTQAVRLSFGGTYSSLKNFLIFAGKSLKLMDIDSIDFKSVKNGEEKPQLANYDFSVGLKTYYLIKNDDISAESKISEANSLPSLSFFQGKQFADLLYLDNYNIDTSDKGDVGNKNIF